jgi:hypothetical protein
MMSEELKRRDCRAGRRRSPGGEAAGSCAGRGTVPASSSPTGRSSRLRSPVAALSRLLLPRTCTASACTYAPQRRRMWSGTRPSLGGRQAGRGGEGARWPCPVAENPCVRGGPWWPPRPCPLDHDKVSRLRHSCELRFPKRSRQAARYSGVTRGSFRSSSLLLRKARTAGSMRARGWSSP